MRIESRDGSRDGYGDGHASDDAAAAKPSTRILGEPFFLWTSIVALGALCRARRDDACLRTATKLALAVSGSYAVARATRLLSGGASGRDFFSGHRAAAWAAAGVIQQEQGKGTALAAYTAAALSGSRGRGGSGAAGHRSARRAGIADLVAGAVVGRVMSRLVARL